MFGIKKSLIDLIEENKGTGKYGMIIKTGDRKGRHISKVDYFIEFKHLGSSTNNEGEKYHNIIPINVTCKCIEYTSDRQIKDFLKIRWVSESSSIYWLDTNSANIRENIINGLLEKK